MPPTIPNPTDVTTWPSALVTVVLLVLVLGLPSVLTYLGNKRTQAVQKTLTTNNGGSTVLDKLDRIESKLVDLADVPERLAALEAAQAGGDPA